MAEIADLVEKMHQMLKCELYPSLGLPIVGEQHLLPEDLKQFCRLCGGASLYGGMIKILHSYEVVLANSRMLIGLDDEGIATYKKYNGISWSWYLIVDYQNGNYVSIDLSPERLGQCYDSNHELHPDSPIIAYSFTEMLEWLLSDKWNHREYPEFPRLGSPYSQS